MIFILYPYIKELFLDTFIDYSQTNKIHLKNPFGTGIAFKDISFAATDSANNLYIIDNNSNRILKTDSNDKLEFKLDRDNIMPYILKSESSSEEIVYNITNLAVDQKQNLYIAFTCFNIHGRYVRSELILRYTQTGIYDGMVYRVSYANEPKPIEAGHIRGLQVKNNILYFYIKDNTDGSAKMEKYNCKTKTLDNTEYIINLRYIKEIIGTGLENKYVSTVQGKIFYVDIGGNSNEIHPSTGKHTSKLIPSNLNLHNGELFFINKEDNISILYLNIQSFYKMKEAQCPEDRFKLINRLFGIFSSKITEHNGFISQSFGASLVAVFPKRCYVLRSRMEGI